MEWGLFARYLPLLASGFAVTLLCWLAGAVVGVAAGFAVALLRLLPVPPLRAALTGYVEAIRGTPFLVQLFLLYDGGPSLGLRLPAITCGIVALGVYGSAYFAEIFRSGFAAVPPGQVEAAASLGMPAGRILRRVRVPAMLVAILPALVNMLIVLSKETVILSVIAVPELMYQVQTMAAETFAALETIFALAVLYWVMVEAMARLGRAAERRVARHLLA